jgi:hypothetical protein
MLESVNVSDGKFILIAELTDDQLRFHVKRRIETLAALREASNSVQDQFAAAMYNREIMTPKAAGQMVRSEVRALYPFLAEMYLRQINDEGIVNDLQAAIGRKGAMPVYPMKILADFTAGPEPHVAGVRVVFPSVRGLSRDPAYESVPPSGKLHMGLDSDQFNER